MPKIELQQYGDDQEILFKPSLGDVRINNFGTMEQFDSGAWLQIGNIQELFNDVLTLKLDSVNVKTWRAEQENKDKEQIIADELEDQFDDLREAGQHLRQLEKMLRIARKTYDSMTIETKEKLKTFERLDTPYPDSAENPGYQI